ncbi:hypothetical protein HPP92_006549 [Vanilla planifolia]|uniref:Uncharacterized protein n=1 Tax=Vanilla planifolia TaxID=51239 RepID=A0A835VB14_VANPL|nr:hypothetical protein HPP92_006549 [Vanilla planifolia]
MAAKHYPYKVTKRSIQDNPKCQEKSLNNTINMALITSRIRLMKIEGNNVIRGLEKPQERYQET